MYNRSLSFIDFDLIPIQTLYECQYYEENIFHIMKYDLKCPCYVIERFCDFVSFIPSDLITTLSYVPHVCGFTENGRR